MYICEYITDVSLLIAHFKLIFRTAGYLTKDHRQWSFKRSVAPNLERLKVLDSYRKIGIQRGAAGGIYLLHSASFNSSTSPWVPLQKEVLRGTGWDCMLKLHNGCLKLNLELCKSFLSKYIRAGYGPARENIASIWWHYICSKLNILP